MPKSSPVSAPVVKIGLMGASLGTGNRGVSALAASVISLAQNAYPGAEVTLLIGNRTNKPFMLRHAAGEQVVPVINYRLSLRSWTRDHYLWIIAASVLYRILPLAAFRRLLLRSTPWLKFVVEADAIFDIRGGDSFSDIYGLYPYLIDGILIWSVLLVRKRIGLLPQTYGPYKSKIARSFARYLLRRADPLLARDLESAATVASLLGENGNCRVCPDVAFSLQRREPSKALITPPLEHIQKERLVGINVNGLMFNGGYTRKNMFGLKLDYRAFLPRLVQAFLADPDIHVLLVPHTFSPSESVESDPGACSQVADQLSPELRGRVHLLAGEYDQSEIKFLIGQCDFFVGSRMHACIAALSQGIPAIGVAYSKKFRGVFESVGVTEFVIDGRDFHVDSALERAVELYASRQRIRPTLQDAVVRAKNCHERIFSGLLASMMPCVNFGTDPRNHWTVSDPAVLPEQARSSS